MTEQQWRVEASRLYRDGANMNQVSAMLGISGDRVRRALQQQHVEMRPRQHMLPRSDSGYVLPDRVPAPEPDPGWQDRAVALYAQGLPVSQVAEQVGTSPRYARKALLSAGVELRTVAWNRKPSSPADGQE